MHYLHRIFLLLTVTFILVQLQSCNTTEPPSNQTLTLELEDVSCTEAWIKLTTTNLQLPATINLLRDGNLSETINLLGADTLLYVDSLLPNQSYRFRTIIQLPNQSITNSSNELTVTTMDTTSHNFTWQSWEFGQHSSSTLYDVAIIDENNIWAVGEIYMLDSLGNPDPNAYNAVHWDGTKWELKKIGGQGGWACHTVFAFSANDIWFEGNIHWNGSTYTAHMNGWPLMPNGDGWQVNKMWGSSSEDLYAVGNNGNIAHWDGRKWTKIESGTTIALLDVWGSPDGTVWACGYNSNYSITTLIKIKNEVTIKLYEGSPNNQNNNLYIGPLSGGWTNSKFFTYLLNWGALYRQDNKEELDLSTLSQPFFYDVAFSICANGKNDIIVSGESGMFGHYNGVRFYELPDLRRSNLQYLASDIKGNLFITVGWDYSTIQTKAIITVGTR